MLRWAIDRAGYELEEFLAKDEKWQEWVKGSRKPTYAQLRDFADRLHVNPLVLLGDSPPDESLAMPYFRGAKATHKAPSLNVYDTIQLLQLRQDWLSEYMELELGFAPLPFVGSSTTHAEAIASIREVLKIPAGWQLRHRGAREALGFLVEQCEQQNIFISSNGIVGNSTGRPISVEECRGFALSDRYAPFIFLNARDAPVANLFTLAHELAHIWMGRSAAHDNNAMVTDAASDPTERMCDLVAVELLMPEGMVRQYFSEGHSIEKAATHFRVSTIAMARRAFEVGHIDREKLERYFQNYREQRIELAAEPKSQKGGSFYPTAIKRIGRSFSRFVDSAVQNHHLSHRDAYRLMGLRGKTYDTYIEKLGV